MPPRASVTARETRAAQLPVATINADLLGDYVHADIVDQAAIALTDIDKAEAVIEKLKGHPLFAHVTLTRSERSPIAALVTEMLEEISPGALP